MRYNAEQTQMTESPFEGRGTGVRHSGGGDMSGGKKSGLPTAGYTAGPTGGLQVGGYNPSPGGLFREGGLQTWSPSPTSMGGSTWNPWW